MVTHSKQLVLAVLLGGLVAVGLELLTRGGSCQVLAALLGAVLSGATFCACRPTLLARGTTAVVLGLATIALYAACPALGPDLVLGVIHGAGAAGLGLAHEGRRSAAARLRWLLFPQLSVIVTVSELAYLRRLPSRLLGWPGADKVLHLVLFGLAVFLLDLWLRRRDLRLGRARLPLSLLLSLVVAALEEGAQLLSRSRTGSLGDLGADLIGMVLGVLIARRLLATGEIAPGAGGLPSGDQPSFALVPAHGPRLECPRASIRTLARPAGRPG